MARRCGLWERGSDVSIGWALTNLIWSLSAGLGQHYIGGELAATQARRNSKSERVDTENNYSRDSSMEKSKKPLGIREKESSHNNSSQDETQESIGGWN